MHVTVQEVNVRLDPLHMFMFLCYKDPSVSLIHILLLVQCCLGMRFVQK